MQPVLLDQLIDDATDPRRQRLAVELADGDDVQPVDDVRVQLEYADQASAIFDHKRACLP